MTSRVLRAASTSARRAAASPVSKARSTSILSRTSRLATRSSRETSARDGYIYWMGPELYGVKWRNFKLIQVHQVHMTDAPHKLATRRLVNLTVDPHEREHFNYPHLHSWVAFHISRLLKGYQASVAEEPLIPLGAPLDHVPAQSGTGSPGRR